MFKPGTIIGNKYEIIKQIGKGGMSVVYLAIDRNLNKYWTIKEIIKSGKTKNDKVIFDSLIAEANLIKGLDHSAIPRIVEIINMGDTLLIVRDYIEGEPMNKILKNFGSQPQSSVVDWMIQLCDVLDYLHNLEPKIIYRDMKPANIMLVSDGSLRLIDFGIAKEIKNKSDYCGECTGTKGFAPPEQFRKDRYTDERSDIYALGMTIYQLATGISPTSAVFDKDKPVCEINNSYSTAFSDIISKCIQENPEDRFQNCSELRYALHRFVNHSRNISGKKKTAQKKEIILKGIIGLVSVLCVMGFALDLAEWLKNGYQNFLCGSGILSFSFAALIVVVYELRIFFLKNTDKKENVLKGNNKNYIVSEIPAGSFFDHIQSNDIAKDTAEGDANHALNELLSYYNNSQSNQKVTDNENDEVCDVKENDISSPYPHDLDNKVSLKSVNTHKDEATQLMDEEDSDDITILSEDAEDEATQLMDEEDSDDIAILSEDAEDEATQLMDEEDSDDTTILSEDAEDEATQLMDEEDSDDITILSEDAEDEATQLMDEEDSDDTTILSEDAGDEATQLMDEEDSDDITILPNDSGASGKYTFFEILVDKTVVHADEIIKIEEAD